MSEVSGNAVRYKITSIMSSFACWKWPAKTLTMDTLRGGKEIMERQYTCGRGNTFWGQLQLATEKPDSQGPIFSFPLFHAHTLTQSHHCWWLCVTKATNVGGYQGNQYYPGNPSVGGKGVQGWTTLHNLGGWVAGARKILSYVHSCSLTYSDKILYQQDIK